VASDIADYGLEDCKSGVDYLKAQAIAGVEGNCSSPG
jgi:hypothetical protein